MLFVALLLSPLSISGRKLADSFRYFNEISSVSARFLSRNQPNVSFPINPRTLRRSSSEFLDPGPNPKPRTVLVSYKFPTFDAAALWLADDSQWIGHGDMDGDREMEGDREMDRHTKMQGRLLQAVESFGNVTRPSPLTGAGYEEDPALVEETAANIIARNVVLSRLYVKLFGSSVGQLSGLQSTSPFGFNTSYLTGLHMEVLTAPAMLSSEVVRKLLVADPMVENVWFDEILQGDDEIHRGATENQELHGQLGEEMAGEERETTKKDAGTAETVYMAGSGRRDRYDLRHVPNTAPIARPPEMSSATFEPFLTGVSGVKVNDQHFHHQWGLHHNRYGIGCPAAWNIWTAENSEITIALIDAGVDLDHPETRSRYWRNQGEKDCFDGVDDDDNGYVDDCIGWDWIDNDNVPQDENGHGSASAGVIAATPNNHQGIAGICWGCKLMVLRTLDKDIRGTISGFIKAIDYSVVQGVKISNNSYGGRGSSFASLQTAVKRARKQGMIFVAAAGNYGSNNDLTSLQPTFPASYDEPNIISVAAIDSSGDLASFSCYGKKSVDIAAPGVGIFSTALGKKYNKLDGTSFAAPFVTAAAALIWSADPSLTYDQVIKKILSTATPVAGLKDKVSSGGTLNLAAALGTTKTKDREAQGDQEGAGDRNGLKCAQSNLCPPNSDCVDTTLGLRCRCHVGYSHNNGKCLISRMCSIRDASSCPVHEVCEEVDKGATKCLCEPGFFRRSSAEMCEDINECALDRYICPKEAQCVNTAGAFDCKCPIGTRWNGLAWVQRGAACLDNPKLEGEI